MIPRLLTLALINTAAFARCQCDDPDAAEVAALMLTGLSQREASLIVWGDPADLSPAGWSAWVTRTVRVAFGELHARWSA